MATKSREKSADLDAQRAAAEELQKQIDALISGTAQEPPPEEMTFRDFVHRKTASPKKTKGRAK